MFLQLIMQEERERERERDRERESEKEVSFCNKILAEKADKVGIYKKFKIIFKILLIKELLSNLFT
jgi:hypothetical protein